MAGVVDDDQLPHVLGQRLLIERAQYANEIIAPGIVCTQDDRDFWHGVWPQSEKPDTEATDILVAFAASVDVDRGVPRSECEARLLPQRQLQLCLQNWQRGF